MNWFIGNTSHAVSLNILLCGKGKAANSIQIGELLYCARVSCSRSICSGSMLLLSMCIVNDETKETRQREWNALANGGRTMHIDSVSVARTHFLLLAISCYYRAFCIQCIQRSGELCSFSACIQQSNIMFILEFHLTVHFIWILFAQSGRLFNEIKLQTS